jgi:hypothetical protein
LSCLYAIWFDLSLLLCPRRWAVLADCHVVKWVLFN